MDSMISLAAVLFILSMINERIANFIKLQFSGSKFLWITMGNLREKKDDGEEDDRNKRIILLNIVIGTVVCLMLRADLINIVANIDEPSEGIGWKTFDPSNAVNWITLFPGCFLTGCFLSLGSKFWHDLLDLLLYVKDIKGSISKKAAAAEEDNNDDAIEDAVERFKQQIINISNVTSVSLNSKLTPQQVEVFVNEYYKGETLIPKKIFYLDSNNQKKSIDVMLINDFNPKVHSNLWPGDPILNKSPYPSNRGAMGGKVYDQQTNEPYFISCYHVVKSPAHSWEFQANGNEQVLEFQSNGLCGSIVKAKRDDEVDAAIMKAAGNFTIMDGINGIGTPYLVRDLNPEDKRLNTSVQMYSCMTQELKTGYITDINVPAKLLYYKDHSQEMEYHRLDKLIFVRSDDDSPFSLPGDSGSLVIDEYNYLIGLLVGGQGVRSFVIPINTVFSRLKIKLQPQ